MRRAHAVEAVRDAEATVMAALPAGALMDRASAALACARTTLEDPPPSRTRLSSLVAG